MGAIQLILAGLVVIQASASPFKGITDWILLSFSFLLGEYTHSIYLESICLIKVIKDSFNIDKVWQQPGAYPIKIFSVNFMLC